MELKTFFDKLYYILIVVGPLLAFHRDGKYNPKIENHLDISNAFLKSYIEKYSEKYKLQEIIVSIGTVWKYVFFAVGIVIAFKILVLRENVGAKFGLPEYFAMTGILWISNYMFLNFKKSAFDYLNLVWKIPSLMMAPLILDLIMMSQTFDLTRSAIGPIYTAIGHDPSVSNFNEAFTKSFVVAIGFLSLAAGVATVGLIILVPAFLFSIGVGIAMKYIMKTIIYIFPRSILTPLGYLMMLVAGILSAPA